MSFVALMNMPEKKQEAVLKKMEASNSMAIHGDLCVLTMGMCDEVSHDEETKHYRNEGMRKTNEANRRSRTPLQKCKESALLGSIGDQMRPRAANLGCYCCGEFGHLKRECIVDPETIRCSTCKISGHVAEVCPTTHELYGSRNSSLSRARRPSSRGL